MHVKMRMMESWVLLDNYEALCTMNVCIRLRSSLLNQMLYFLLSAFISGGCSVQYYRGQMFRIF